ncbi:MAG: DUF4145 domain-containing protein [Mesorhizobium sp.]|nr:MAG: DUF4145 domain-containing protein [Mesorhizobium sp.]
MAIMTPHSLQAVPSCPRCNRANPAFVNVGGTVALPMDQYGLNNVIFFSGVYRCTTCGRTVLAESQLMNVQGQPAQIPVQNLLPRPQDIDAAILGKPRQFLSDALTSLNAPTASIMASCSAIDAMLKEKGVGRLDPSGKERSLYKRIEEAVGLGILTADMAKWAHKVRLDANDQRHADDDAPIPSQSQAQSIFDLANGLAEVLIVLPSKVASLDQVSKPQGE